jgi:hypothetical protein
MMNAMPFASFGELRERCSESVVVSNNIIQ